MFQISMKTKQNRTKSLFLRTAITDATCLKTLLYAYPINALFTLADSSATKSDQHVGPTKVSSANTKTSAEDRYV